MIQRIIINIKSKVGNPTKINVRQAVEMITGSWTSVLLDTIRNCWRKAGFGSFNDVVELENCQH